MSRHWYISRCGLQFDWSSAWNRRRGRLPRSFVCGARDFGDLAVEMHTYFLQTCVQAACEIQEVSVQKAMSFSNGRGEGSAKTKVNQEDNHQ